MVNSFFAAASAVVIVVRLFRHNLVYTDWRWILKSRLIFNLEGGEKAH